MKRRTTQIPRTKGALLSLYPTPSLMLLRVEISERFPASVFRQPGSLLFRPKPRLLSGIWQAQSALFLELRDSPPLRLPRKPPQAEWRVICVDTPTICSPPIDTYSPGRRVLRLATIDPTLSQLWPLRQRQLKVTS